MTYIKFPEYFCHSHENTIDDEKKVSGVSKLQSCVAKYQFAVAKHYARTQSTACVYLPIDKLISLIESWEQRE